MQKNKVVKIICMVFAFLITVYVSLTYISVGNFNLISFGKSTGLLFSDSQPQSYNREYIVVHQSVNVSEPNGVGTISHDYSLSFDQLPKDIVAISLNFDSSKASLGNVSLNVLSGENNTSFNISTSANTSLIQAGIQNADEIKITSRFDQYGGAVVSNEEVVSISSVKINAEEDIKLLKKQFLFDLLESMLVSAIIWLIVFSILKSKVDTKIFKNTFSIEKTFLVTALVVGVIFALLFPVYQIPDEQTHINIIYEELNWDINIKTQGDISNFADTIRIIRNYDEKVNLSTYVDIQIASPLPDDFSVPSIKLIRHLPQAVGFVLTSLLRMPLWICVSFAEICAVIVYAIFGYLAVKLMPFKKELMTAIMLLPICLQEFPSLSYDSFLMASYFLLFAYILHVKFTKEEFTLIDVAIMVALIAVIVITKIPYALVALLIVTIPVSKIDFNFGFFKLNGELIKKRKVAFSILAAFLIAVAAVGAIKILPYISEGKTFIGAMYDIKASIKLVFLTVKAYFGEWLTQITGDLGWFDTPVALIFTVFVILNLLFLNLFDYNNKSKCPFEKNPFKKIELVIVFVVALGMTFVTVLSMFGWTMKAYGIDMNTLTTSEVASYMNQIPYIGGLQGRYFVPIIPLLLVPCYFPKFSASIQKINYKAYLCGYHLTVYIYLFVVVLKRYWI